MRIIDADKFLKYMIFSKHIDGLTCGEVQEAIEMCKVDILDKLRAEIDNALSDGMIHKKTVLGIIDKYKGESEDKE